MVEFNLESEVQRGRSDPMLGEGECDAEPDALYEKYGKPLEVEHYGEFVAVSPDGRTLLGSTLLEAAQQATLAFDQVIFVFKVGERVVGRIG